MHDWDDQRLVLDMIRLGHGFLVSLLFGAPDAHRQETLPHLTEVLDSVFGEDFPTHALFAPVAHDDMSGENVSGLAQMQDWRVRHELMYEHYVTKQRPGGPNMFVPLAGGRPPAAV